MIKPTVTEMIPALAKRSAAETWMMDNIPKVTNNVAIVSIKYCSTVEAWFPIR